MGSDYRVVKQVGDYTIYTHSDGVGDGRLFSVSDADGNFVFGNRESLYDTEEDLRVLIDSGGIDTDEFDRHWIEKKASASQEQSFGRPRFSTPDNFR